MRSRDVWWYFFQIQLLFIKCKFETTYQTFTKSHLEQKDYMKHFEKENFPDNVCITKVILVSNKASCFHNMYLYILQFWKLPNLVLVYSNNSYTTRLVLSRSSLSGLSSSHHNGSMYPACFRGRSLAASGEAEAASSRGCTVTILNCYIFRPYSSVSSPASCRGNVQL